MKMYKKSDLTIIDGMLVNKDQDIVVPNQDVIMQANELDTLIQQHQYLSAQPAAQPMPSLDGFQRKSIKDDSDKVFNAVTPLMDFKAAEAMKLMDELDDVASAHVANDLLAKFDKLAQFTKNDYVIDCGVDGLLLVFDTPVLGNVLELTYDELCAMVAMLVGFAPENELKKSDPDADDEDIETLKDFLAEDDMPSMVTAIPATKENLDKVMEFFSSFCDEDKAHDDNGTKKADSDGVASLLANLAQDVNDLCGDIEE